MNRDEAEQLSILYLQLVSKLNQSAEFVRDTDTKENWKSYCQAVGKAMGVIISELEEPLWKRFPELEPEELGGPYKIDSEIHDPFFYWPTDEEHT